MTVRTSVISTATAPSSVAPIKSAADARLLKKIHAIRPMLADREGRKKLDKLPPR